MNNHLLWFFGWCVVFYTAPIAMIMTHIVLGAYVRRFFLAAMLEALKNSLLFSSRHARGLDDQGSLYRNLLLLDMGVAFVFSRVNIHSGVLDAEDLARFPRRFRIMAVINAGCFYGAMLAMLIVFPAMQWERFVRTGQVFDVNAAFQVLLYGSPVIALSITWGLTVYAVHYHLPTMLDAIKRGPLSRLSQAMAIGEGQASWRSMLFIRLSRAVVFKSSKKSDAIHDIFDLDALPVSFKRLAVASLLCLHMGISGLVIAGLVYALRDTAV